MLRCIAVESANLSRGRYRRDGAGYGDAVSDAFGDSRFSLASPG